MECHQAKVLQAKRRLSECASQAELIAQRESSYSRSRANDIKARVEILQKSRHIIVGEIAPLKARRAQLMKELEAVTTPLQKEGNKLEQLPRVIEKMKEDTKTPVREALSAHKKIQPMLISRRLMRLTNSACVRSM